MKLVVDRKHPKSLPPTVRNVLRSCADKHKSYRRAIVLVETKDGMLGVFASKMSDGCLLDLITQGKEVITESLQEGA